MRRSGRGPDGAKWRLDEQQEIGQTSVSLRHDAPSTIIDHSENHIRTFTPVRESHDDEQRSDWLQR